MYGNELQNSSNIWLGHFRHWLGRYSKPSWKSRSLLAYRSTIFLMQFIPLIILFAGSSTIKMFLPWSWRDFTRFLTLLVFQSMVITISLATNLKLSPSAYFFMKEIIWVAYCDHLTKMCHWIPIWSTSCHTHTHTPNLKHIHAHSLLLQAPIWGWGPWFLQHDKAELYDRLSWSIAYWYQIYANWAILTCYTLFYFILYLPFSLPVINQGWEAADYQCICHGY